MSESEYTQAQTHPTQDPVTSKEPLINKDKGVHQSELFETQKLINGTGLHILFLLMRERKR